MKCGCYIKLNSRFTNVMEVHITPLEISYGVKVPSDAKICGGKIKAELKDSLDCDGILDYVCELCGTVINNVYPTTSSDLEKFLTDYVEKLPN